MDFASEGPPAYTTGLGALPDIFAQARGPQVQGHIGESATERNRL